MIIPCIDLMDGKAVQLVQGKDKALEVNDLQGLLTRFRPFPLIHVIDLDAAKGTGSNRETVQEILRSRPARVGGGLRTAEDAVAMVEAGAFQVIVGTSAFTAEGVNHAFLRELHKEISPFRVCIALDSLHNQIVVRGWAESIQRSAQEVIQELSPYCTAFLCTFVDTEGTMRGSNLGWFEHLQEATSNQIIAAGGFSELSEVEQATRQGLDVALGMAIYTGKLDLSDLQKLNESVNLQVPG